MRSPLTLLGGLYFAQGVPWGFVTVALAVRLARAGTSPAALGTLIWLATLPWTGKPIMGPFFDRFSFGRWGRRRPMVMLLNGLTGLSLLAMAAVTGADPASATSDHQVSRWFLALVFMHNVCAAGQDVATDAFAIESLAEDERGRANGVMSAAKYGGVFVGSSVILWIVEVIGWPVATALAAFFVLLPGGLAWFAHEPSRQHGPAPRVVRETVRALFSARARWVLAFVLLAGASDAFLQPLVYPLFTRTLGLSPTRLNTLITVGTLVSAAAAVGGGWAADRWGRKRVIAAGALALAGVNGVFACSRPFWASFLFLFATTVASAAAAGALESSSIALCMDVTDPTVGATQFQIYMSLFNARMAWSSWVGGRLAGRLSAPAMYAVAAGLELLPLPLLGRASQPVNRGPAVVK